MLSEPQLKEVWEEWLAAEVRANYFADLCGTLQRRHRLATGATLLLTSGAAFVFIGKFQALPEWVVPSLALLAAGVSFYSVVAQNPKGAAECADLHSRWNKLARDYQALWMDWGADDAAARFAQLQDRSGEASKSGASYRYDEKRMMKWFDLVVQHRAPSAAA